MQSVKKVYKSSQFDFTIALNRPQEPDHSDSLMNQQIDYDRICESDQ